LVLQLAAAVSRYVRIYLIACIALAFGYLVIHAGEPMRLGVGDAWADASVLTSIEHGSDVVRGTLSVPELLYGAVGRLVGAHQLAVFRLLALAFSGLAVWLLFLYARRMWNDTVAVIATALTTTSLAWMLFADSLQRPPIVHAACFLALWGVVRALETRQWRHHVAVLGGTFVCLIAGSDDWLFLPAGVLFTVYVKRGSPLSRDNWKIVATFALGALLAYVMQRPFVVAPSDWQSTLDHRVSTAFPTMLRRYAALLSPMLWVTLGWAVWRALRAESVKDAIVDGTTWILVAAVVFAYLPATRPESTALRTQMLLPLYAIGSALLIARLLDGGRLRRTLAAAWCVAAPLWGGWLMVHHPRAVLDPGDQARANDYLAKNDRNGFVISNLLADGPIVAGFGRHAWTRLIDRDPTTAERRVLELMTSAGTDYVHAVIFKQPESRFVERSIAQITPVMRRGGAAFAGWPYVVRDRVNALIARYDAEFLRTLIELGATRMLQLDTFDIYRIDRSAVLETAAKSLPVVQRIDFDRLETLSHQLLGWGDLVDATEPRAVPSSIVGYGQCHNPIAATTTPAPSGCTVEQGAKGLYFVDAGRALRADLLVRVERACDQQVTVTLAAPALLDIAFNDVVMLSCGDSQWGTSLATVRVPRQHVHPGLNIISLDDVQKWPQKVRPEIRSVVIEPVCAASP
jgi:hypothetical protein